MRKLDLRDPIVWWHHRSGWKYVVEVMAQRLHDPNGILCHTYADWLLAAEISLERPWVGFLHGTVTAPPELSIQYQRVWSLEEFLADDRWARVARNCRVLFTLSSHTRRYLESRVHCPVDNLLHPTDLGASVFTPERFECNTDRKVVLIGHWLRRWQDIYDLPVTRLRKVLLRGADCDYLKLEHAFKLRINPSVHTLPRLSDSQYDQLLSENIVFLPLYDAAAVNTLVECIVRNTPVLLNRLESHRDYLPDDYPFYYDSLEEAAEKVEDPQALLRAYECLRDIPKQEFHIDRFIDQLTSSPLYQSL